MADIALGSVERIFKAGLAIKKAAKTVQQNKKECRDIERSVARAGALLSLLNETTETFKHPAISEPLEDLAESMEEALELIKDCEGKNSIRRLFGAGGMARELGRVHDDILRKLMMGNFATTVHITITLTRTVQCSVAHHPHMQLQDAGEVMGSYNGHFTADDASHGRSGINSEITMETTPTEVSYDPSSRLTEFSLSELEATTTMHHVSEENISAGGVHSFVLKQKIVIKVSMGSEKSRIRALTLVAKADGVSSLWITGDGRDTLEVVGEGVDAVCLIKSLREKLGHADLLKVEEVCAKAAQAVPVVLKGEEVPPAARSSGGIRDIVASLSRFMWPRARRSISSRPPQAPRAQGQTSAEDAPDVCVLLDAGGQGITHS